MGYRRSLQWVTIYAAVALAETMAGAVPPIVNDAPRPHIAVPKAGVIPLVTAAADDPAWNRAALIPLNTLSLSAIPPPVAPIPGTEVRLLWDAEWLYIRFLCRDDKTYLPVHGYGAPIYHGDVVEIFLDPVGDCRKWMELQFNAANDRFDSLATCTAEPKWDRSLRLTKEFRARHIRTLPIPGIREVRSATAPWKVKGLTVGWIVDVAIPASVILRGAGLKKFSPMNLRGDFLRYKWIPRLTGTKRDLLSLTWSPMLLGVPHQSPAAFGVINLAAAVE